MPLQRWSGTSRHVFDDLAEFFRVKRIIHEIRSLQRMESERRYRIVTCLMGNFCATATPERMRSRTCPSSSRERGPLDALA